MKKGIINAAKMLCFLALLGCVTYQLNYVLQMKYNLGIRQFYPLDKNTADVMLFGSSHAEYGVNTAYLWDDYGIAAYSMTEGAQNFGTTYYYMVEALKYQKPKVMIVEVTYTVRDWEYAGQDNGNIIGSTIMMRWSKNYLDNMKYNLEVAERLSETELDSDFKKNLLLKFPFYHTRYTELREMDYEPINVARGRYEGGSYVYAMDRPEAAYCEDYSPNGYDDIYRKEYLDKMIQLCKENDIQLVFWLSPFAVSEDYMKIYNTVGKYVKEQGCDFVNFGSATMQDEIGLDFATDMVDTQHVNYEGCHKLSKYWGQYLTDHCGIVSRKDDPYYSVYNDIAEFWHEREAYLRSLGM